MTRNGKNVGKADIRLQDKTNIKLRVMITNHAGRNWKETVRLAMNLGDMIPSSNARKDGASNNAEIMVHDVNDLMDEKFNQEMTRKDQTAGKTHSLLEDETHTQQRTVITNNIARNSKRRGRLAKELVNMSASGKDRADYLDEESDEGMGRNVQNVGQNHSPLEDESLTQPQNVIDNNVAGNSKKKGHLAREPSNVVAREKVIGLTSKRSFNNNSLVESMVQNHNVDMSEEPCQDSESESHDDVKKTRGPTFWKEIWGRPSTLPPIKIYCDDMGRPIGSRRNKFIDFLGSLARNGKFCPVDVENWKKMPMDKKQKMLDIIKEKYDLPPGTENWTLCSIAKKWRNWKSELKKKYYDPELPVQILLQHRDERALVEQYVKLVHWNSEKSKERSEKNKVARKQKIMNQTTGRKSFAQVQQKLRK